MEDPNGECGATGHSFLCRGWHTVVLRHRPPCCGAAVPSDGGAHVGGAKGALARRCGGGDGPPVPCPPSQRRAVPATNLRCPAPADDSLRRRKETAGSRAELDG